MDRQQFDQALNLDVPPANWSLPLQALWYAARDQWDQAHACAQEDHSEWGSWVHAHLHRQEGDTGNAAYWYRRAAQPFPKTTIQQEWSDIVDAVIRHGQIDDRR